MNPQFSPNVKNDLLAGLTVALALVPEAVAFALVAGVEPLVGLYAAFIMGLVTSLLGGRPGMISGATGAVAVVYVALVVSHGVEYMFAAVLLAGIIQISFGLLGLGKFARLVPHPVMFGFLNGLAIVIMLAQFGSFQVATTDALGVVTKSWLPSAQLYTMIGLVALTMAIIYLLPKVSKAVPPALAAIVAVTLVVMFSGLSTRTVGDLASIQGGLPSFHWPFGNENGRMPFNLEALKVVFPYALAVAGVGLVESLLTLSVIDEMTESRGNNNKECVALGLGNTLCGLFGGMGGCAMIGQSVINVKSGGRGRLSGLTASLVLLGFILFASSLIEMVPLAALTGVMFMVVIGTFEWSTFRIIRKIPASDAFVIVLVAAVTVVADLAIAVLIGVICSALTFAWEKSKRMGVTVVKDSLGWKVYQLDGPLFFGSVEGFKDLFDPKNDYDDVVIDFANAHVYGHAAIEAIDALAVRYLQHGKRLHLVHLSADCKQLLHKAGDMVEVNVLEDPTYRMAIAEPAANYHATQQSETEDTFQIST